MRRREDKALTKHTLNLYMGDYNVLQTVYGSRIGAAKIIRDLVKIHVNKIKAKSEQKVDPLIEDPLAPELDELLKETQ
jgi:hypothetical protein